MPRRTLVLASSSPARLRLLEDAGFDPRVAISGVDETQVSSSGLPDLVQLLAELKARAVARPGGTSVVVGCDSMLEFDGTPHGKPASEDEARRWLRSMRNRSGTLFTGHCVVDEQSGRQACATGATLVHFGPISDEEIDAYLSTGEALNVAGAFTLDGRSAPFVRGVEGDPSNVIGLSLPLFRSMLSELGLTVSEFWKAPI